MSWIRDWLKRRFGPSGLDEIYGKPLGGQKSGAIAEGYEMEYPMLPKRVVYKAVDRGYPFSGSLGPEHILHIDFFRALVNDGSTTDQSAIDEKAVAMAHKVYEFYLRFPILLHDPATAQQKATDFWHEIASPLP